MNTVAMPSRGYIRTKDIELEETRGWLETFLGIVKKSFLEAYGPEPVDTPWKNYQREYGCDVELDQFVSAYNECCKSYKPDEVYNGINIRPQVMRDKLIELGYVKGKTRLEESLELCNQ